MQSLRNHAIVAFSLSAGLLLGVCAATAGAMTDAADAEAARQKDAAKQENKVERSRRGEAASKESQGSTGSAEADSPERDGRLIDRRLLRARLPQMPVMLWVRRARALELSEEQQEKINGVVEAHHKAVAKFEEEHGKSLLELRQKLRRANQAEDREAVEDLMEQLSQVRASQPRPSDLQEAIQKKLTEEQRETLRRQVLAWQEEREQLMRQRRERMIEREIGEQPRTRSGRPLMNENTRRLPQPVRGGEGAPTRVRDGNRPGRERPRQSEDE